LLRRSVPSHHVMWQAVGCSLSGFPSESPYVLVDGVETQR
jgi:hypothetical protein